MEKVYKNKNIFMIQYSILQGIFWMAFAVIWGFAVVYLQYRNFTNTEIGTVMSLGTIISVAFQPLLASVIDKSKRLETRHLVLFLTVMLVILGSGLVFAPSNIIIVAILYILTGGFVISFPAFLNTLGLDYSNRGIFLNYGLARGIGSLTYAVISLAMGWLVKIYSPGIIPFVYLILLGILFFILVGLKNIREESLQIEEEKKGERGITDFVRRYGKFLILLVGIMLLFAGHNIINTYMINIIQYVGGDSSHFGMATGLAAALELPTMFMFAYLVGKVSVGKLLKTSAFFFSLKSLVICLAPNIGIIFLSQFFQIGGFALFIPASVYYVNQVIDREYHATGQAAMGTATMGLGGALGNFMGGKILDVAGVSSMLKLCVGITFAGFVITIIFAQEKDKI